MEITGTLTQLKQYFEEWHSSNTNKFDTLHQRLIDRIDNIQNNAQNNNDVLSGKILTLANLISKKLDGSETQISNLNDITNITNKIEATDSTINFKNINNRLSNIEVLTGIIGTDTSGDTRKILDRIKTLETNSLSATNIDDRINIAFKGKDIKSRDDLNSYKTPGIFKCATYNIATSLTNCPINVAFNLVVLEHEDRSCRQIITEYEGNGIWIRNYKNRSETWSNWTELYGEHNTTPFQMQVEFSQSTKTYTVLATKIE